MTESTTRTPSPKSSRALRMLAAAVGGLFGTAAVLLLVVTWLLWTDSGARWTMSRLAQQVGLEFEGVSGNFSGHLHIAHVKMHDRSLSVVADDVDLRWQPATLWQREIRVEQLSIVNLDLALGAGNGQPVKLPASLRLPTMLSAITVRQLSLQHLTVSDLTSDGQHTNPLQFSNLHASGKVDGAGYALQIDGGTPWGNVAVRGTLGNSAPFPLQALFDWQGRPITEGNVTVPAARLTGSADGTLSAIRFNGQLASPNAGDIKGAIVAVLTPFAPLPLDTLHIDLSSVNPADLFDGAPRADLQIKADLTLSGSAAAPQLGGHVLSLNSTPSAWNIGGIPVKQLEADLQLSTSQVAWQRARVTVEHGGTVSGEGRYVFGSHGAGADALPDLRAKLELTNLNLLKLDTRLKKTTLTGTLSVNPADQRLVARMDLRQSDPNLPGALRGEVSVDNHWLLTIDHVDVSDRSATLSATGHLALHGNQPFLLNGQAHNFNPSHWIDVPDGHIDTHFNLAGQLGHNWRIDATIAELGGQFAGMDLHGESDLSAQRDAALTIKKLDLAWGKAELHAHGDWQLGAATAQARRAALEIRVAIPDLAAMSKPFEKLLTVKLQGALSADGELTGSAASPAGHLTLTADRLAIPGFIRADRVLAKLNLEQGLQGRFDGQLDIAGLAAAQDSESPDAASNAEKLQIVRLHGELSGIRNAHHLQVNAELPRHENLTVHVDGDLQESQAGLAKGPLWIAQVTQFNLSGPLDFHLLQPFGLQLSAHAGQIAAANWQGDFGELHLQQLDWAHGQLSTKGQMQGVAIVRLLGLWRTDVPVEGDLLLDTDWQVSVARQVSGQLHIKRRSGDLTLQAQDYGHLQPIALGLHQLDLNATLGDSSGAEHQPASVKFVAQGDQLGHVEASLRSYVAQTDSGWEMPPTTPLTGTAQLQVKDMRWMSQFLGSGFVLHGALNANATLAGSLSRPDYHAVIHGHDIQISYPELGVLFPNGVLDAAIDGDQFRLNLLKFSQSIKKPPHHEFLNDLAWLDQTGFIESSGAVNLVTGQGGIKTTWQKFPLMQSPIGWLVASGQAQLVESGKSWDLTGQLTADAAYFSVPKQAAPKLSSDVVVQKPNDKRSADKTSGMQSNLDFTISTGSNFVFVGRGLDTRLDGAIRIRSKNGGPILATGTIQTEGGTYEGYGQKLAIDRGILNFQGPIDNPGLNVRAIRRGLPVEAGVEVVGTVDKPQVHLVSEPTVPDPDKLSWMVLGRSSDQMAGSEAALLMSAAGAIFGGDGTSNIPGSIARTFGMEDLSIGTSSTAPESQLPTQTVAGTINNSVAPDQVFSVGKRITPNLVFSIERSLTDASNGLKLTWQLTRQFSIIGRAGSDNSVDGQYTITFE